VLGHTKCGAVIGACNDVQLGNLTSLLKKLKPAIANERTVTDNRDGSNNSFVTRVSEQNVLLTIERIRRESAIISTFERDGKIMIVGGLYDVESGKVEFYE